MKNSTSVSSKNELVKIGDAAKAFGVSIDTLRRWETKGKIVPVRTPGGTRLYSLNQLNHVVKKYERVFTNVNETPGFTFSPVEPTAVPEVMTENNLAPTALPQIDSEPLTSLSYPSQTPVKTNFTPAGFTPNSFNHLPAPSRRIIGKVVTLCLIITLFMMIATISALSLSSNKLPGGLSLAAFERENPFIEKIISGLTTPVSKLADRPIIASSNSLNSHNIGDVLAATSPSSLYLDINTDASVSGLLTINGSEIVRDSLTAPNISGNTTVNGNLISKGNLTSQGSLQVLGVSAFNSGITVTGGAAISNTLSVGGDVTFSKLTAGIVKASSTGVLSSGALDLGTSDITGALAIANGGTGASSAPAARGNLGAAASGSNNDITSLNGLTTALSTGQGGTGLTTYATGDLIYASGTNTLGTVSIGSSNEVLTVVNGVPTWSNSASGGVVSLNSLTGALSIAGSGINTVSASGSTITVTGTEADTLASVTGRGASTSTGLTLSSNTPLTLSSTTPSVAIGNTGTLSFTDGTNNLFTIADNGTTGNGTFTGDLAINGNNLTSSSTGTFNLLNTNVATLNIGGSANTLNLAGGSSSTGCTIDASGNITCTGTITSGGGGAVGYWSRSGTILSPVNLGDTLSLDTRGNTAGTLLNISFGASTTLSSALTGESLDLATNVAANNQNVTGTAITLPTNLTNTNASGTNTIAGLSISPAVGSGIDQTGTGATVYSAAALSIPALTQSAGALTGNGLLITTPSSITTNGTANGINIASTGVGAGILNGLNIGNLSSPAAGTETALNIGSNWDSVLSVNGTSVINGSGVVTTAGGGTGLTSYTTGDLIYASANNTLSNLASGTGNNGKVLTVVGGVPSWGNLSGSSCLDCVTNDPSATQTIAPTNASTTGLIVKQTSAASPTADIFDITDSSGSTKYFSIDKSGNVSTAGTSGQTLTLTPLTDTTALTLVGTNVPTASLEYINAKNSQGSIFNLAYGASQTLSTSTALTGQSIDLSTNVTATNGLVNGESITLPGVTNSNITGTKTIKGLVVNTGGGISTTGIGGSTIYSAADLTIPALTQTAGTLTGNGININTPSSITTGGTANGLNIAASGIGAGFLNGINIQGITAGAGSETALNIGSGWDTAINANGPVLINGALTQTGGEAVFTGGNVGVGTSNPDLVNGLSVAGGGTTLNIKDSNSNIGRLAIEGTHADIFLTATDASANQKMFLIRDDAGITNFVPMNDSGTGNVVSAIAIQNSNGNVGIGTTSPSSLFSVGSSSQFQVNSSGAIAAATGITSSGTINFSGLSASSGVYTDASKNLTSTPPSSGTLGYWSRSGTTLSPSNAGDNINTTSYFEISGNRFISSIGSNNEFFGNSAGNTSLTGLSNTGVGFEALNGITTGNGNAALGIQTLLSTTTGSYNAALGYGALALNTTGGSNTAIGNEALFNNTIGNNNTSNGGNALFSNTSGSNNLAEGYGAGYTSVTGNANTTGSNNTFLGYNAGPGTSTQLDNATAIGNAATVSCSNCLTLGSINGVNGATSNTNVGIGTASPTATFQVASSATTTNASEIDANSLTSGTGLYLTSSTLTSGTLASLSSTSTALTTGSLLSLDYSPSSTIATGDLFSLNIGSGASAFTGNLFNLKNNGSSLFAVSPSQVTDTLPTQFTAPGDVSLAYDLNFTNPTSSYIKSEAPIVVQSGETFNSSDLTLRTFNSGQGIFDFAGGVTLNQAQNWTLASSTSALNFQDASANPILNLDSTNDRVGIGTTSPSSLLSVGSSSQFQVDTSGNMTAGTYNGDTLSATSLAFSGASGAISTSTTNSNLTVDANGTGTVSIGGTSTGDVLLAGGSSSTGCTVTNSTGDLNCTGAISSNGTPVTNYWSRTGTTLSPATAGDILSLDVRGNTSGTLLNTSFGAATTLAGSLTAQKLDLSTNLTAANQSVTGESIILPSVSNSSSSINLTGISLSAGGAITTTAGSTNFYGINTTMPALTQTGGTLTAYGSYVTTPSSITTGGTAYGFYVNPTGVLAGSLYGLGIGNITGGAGTETALSIGSGWDNGISFAVNSGLTAPTITQTASNGNLTVAAPSGIINIGSGTGDITLDPGANNIVANLSGAGNFQVIGNNVTTSTAYAITANGLTSGNAESISSNSTAGTGSGSSYLLNLSRSGANANTGHSAYGIYDTITNTNATSGTNIAAYFSASGATTANYGLLVANGNTGLGTTTPGSTLTVSGTLTQSGGAANINATGSSLTNIGNSTGVLTLASGGSSSWINTSGNLTLSTATSGTLALTSAGALNLTSAAGSNVNVYGGSVQALALSGHTVNPTLVGSVGTSMNVPDDVVVQGKYAYLINNSGNTLQVVDVSNPTNPVSVSTVATGAGPNGLVVAGKYAYAANYSGGNIQALDISNPASPLALGTSSTFSSAMSLYAAGKYVYATASNGALNVYDVSNPKNIGSPIGTLASEGGSVIGQGNYLYISPAGNLDVIDISNPQKPVKVGGMFGDVGNSCGNLSNRCVVVSGRYAYIAQGVPGDGSYGFEIIDVKDPANPAKVSTVTNLSSSTTDLFISGRYLYAVTDDGHLYIYDVSNPSSPSQAGVITTQGGSAAYGVYVDGRYAYVVGAANSLQIYDISGIETTSLLAHSLEAGNLQVDSNSNIGNNLSVGGGLNVGIGGIYSNGGIFAGGSQLTSSISTANGASAMDIMSINGITGQATSFAGGTGGAGSAISLTTGTGGAVTATSGTKVGGAGGTLQLVGGAGGAVTGAGTSNTGGIGGGFSLTAGTGGAASGGTANTGGAGGNITFTTGNAGTGGNANAGTLSLDTGTKTGTGTGTINFGTTNATAINIGRSGATLTLASGGTSAWTNTSGNLTLSTATSGTLALTSAGALNLTAASASTVTLASSSTTALNFQSGLLDLDTTDSRVGIGTTTPGYTLDVAGKTAAFNSGKDGSLSSFSTGTSTGLSNVRANTVVATNGYIYSIGGSPTSSGGITTSVFYAKLKADGSNGAFTATTSLPGSGRKLGASVVANGYIYYLGGYDGSNDTSSVLYAKVNADGTLGSWTTTTSMPAAREAGEAFYANGYLYWLEGQLCNPSCTVSVTAYYAKVNADGTVGTWTTGNTTNLGERQGISAVFLNNYVYVIGGVDNGSGQDNTVYYAPLNTDGSIGTWNSTTVVPSSIVGTGIQGYYAGVANGFIYLIGGYYQGSGVSANYLYAKPNSDGSIPASGTGTWVEGSSTLPNGRDDGGSEGQAVAYNGYMYIVGGNDSTNSNTTNTVYYTSTARVSIAGDLDLLGLTSGANPLTGPNGKAGGSIYAGNIFSNNNLEVEGNTQIWGQLAVNKGLTVDTSGNVMIGTAALSTSATDGFLYIPTSAGTPTGTPSVKTSSSGFEFDTTNNKLCAYNFTGTAAWKCSTALSDIAEWAPAANTEPGDVVTVTDQPNTINDPSAPFMLGKSSTPYDNKVVGVISQYAEETNSANGYKLSPDYHALTLAGRVPVKVTTENGPISKGDFLTSSSIPGVAMKATHPGQVVAKAMEDYSEVGIGTILAYVNPSFADPNNVLANLTVDDQGNLIVPQIKTGAITLDNTLVEQSNINQAMLTSVNSNGGLDSSNLTQVGTPVDSSSSAMIADLSSTIQDINSKVTDLNNQIASQSAEIASVKSQTDVLSAQLASQSAQIASLSAQVSEQASSSASASGIAIAPQNDNLNLTPPSILMATGSASLNTVNVADTLSSTNISANNIQVSNVFKSLGQTELGQTTIAGDLSVDGTFSINNGNSINALPTLYIQNSSLAQAVDLFNGQVTIDKTGNLSIQKLTIQATQSLTSANNPTIGSSVIKAGQTSVTIPNNQVSVTAKIFVTPRSKTNNQVLIVSSVNPDQSFTVSINSPQSQDISFDWWIIETASK